MDDNTPGKVQPRLRGSISAHFSQSLAGIVPGAQHPPLCTLKPLAYPCCRYLVTGIASSMPCSPCPRNITVEHGQVTLICTQSD